MSDGMREALEPCPFCGCEAAVSAGSNYSGWDTFWIECAGCSAKSDTTDSLSEAIAAWNSRSSSAAAGNQAARQDDGIKDCPFCGSAMKISPHPINAWAICPNEGCIGARQTIVLEDPAQVAAWNRRSSVVAEAEKNRQRLVAAAFTMMQFAKDASLAGTTTGFGVFMRREQAILIVREILDAQRALSSSRSVDKK